MASSTETAAPAVPQAPERLPADVVQRQAAAAAAERTLVAVLEAFPGPAALLNDRRQVLVANSAFRTAAVDLSPGARPGDALGCVEAGRGPDGCGTSPACMTCGAARAFLCIEGGAQGAVREECLFTRHGHGGEESLEYEAGVTRLDGGLTMIALRDISGEKRRRVLERCFLHDALNAAGGMQGMAELVVAGDERFAGMLPGAAAALVEELRCHQAILSAETGELVPEREMVQVGALFDEVVALYGGSRLRRGWRVELDPAGVALVSDRVLLRRILGNLLKNAIEASCSGSVVRMSARCDRGRVVFTVRNPGEMAADVQQRIFRRSFSTKATRGRGIGTWSVKLLAERYLGGTVSFSCAGGSTVFSVELPSA